MSKSAVVSDAKAPGDEHLAPEEVLQKLEVLVGGRQNPAPAGRAAPAQRHRFPRGPPLQGSHLPGFAGRPEVPLRRATDRVSFPDDAQPGLASPGAIEEAESTSRTNHEGNASELQIPTDQHNPETALIEREDTDIVTAIYECLAGDDEAQFVIMALADGKKGKELRDEIGIDQAAYDYAMRRIRKALAKKFPKGIPS